MDLNIDTETPITPITDNKPKNNNGLKIATIVACVLAVCSIGFGIYGIIENVNKSQEILNLKQQIEDQNTAIANLSNTPEQNNSNNDIITAAEKLCQKNDGNFSSNSELSLPNTERYYTCATRQGLKFAINIFDGSFTDNETANAIFKKMQIIGEGNKSDDLTVLEVKPDYFKGYESSTDGYTFFAGFNNVSIELFTTSIAAGNNYLFDLGYPLEY